MTAEFIVPHAREPDGRPEVVAEAKRRLEAGETVTVESLADVMEGRADDPAQNEGGD